jgi:nitrogen regulatory protein PII
MYWLICFIRATALQSVREELENIGCLGVTVSEVEGFGRQRGHTEYYRGAEYQVFMTPKVRLELACTQGELNFALQAIREGAKSGTDGSFGDGKIFVFSLGDAVRIRTGEVGKRAIE